MKVFKFGGASLKDAQGIKNVVSIINSHSSDKLLVVVSAMGKTTNMLERILTLSGTEQDYRFAVAELKKYHHDTIDTLFQKPILVLREVDTHFKDLERELLTQPLSDRTYDQVVSKGELI